MCFTGKGKVRSEYQHALKAREAGDTGLAAAARLLLPKESSSPYQTLISETLHLVPLEGPSLEK